MYNKRGTTKRRPGSCRPAIKMTKRRLTSLKKMVNNRDNVSSPKLAKKFNCTPGYIRKRIHGLGLRCYEKSKAPSYTPDQLRAVLLFFVCCTSLLSCRLSFGHIIFRQSEQQWCFLYASHRIVRRVHVVPLVSTSL